MDTLHCKTKPLKIKDWLIVVLPKIVSDKLPSRGMVMARGFINNMPFTIALEPDGKRSHWFVFDKNMQEATGISEGEKFSLTLTPLTDWPEPEMPADLQNALETDAEVSGLWQTVTTKARWDWIRWIRATKNPETRKIRIEKTLSKLRSGNRNPCCFNRSMCTVPEVSKSGVLVATEFEQK